MSDKLVECLMETDCVGVFYKWLIAIHASRMMGLIQVVGSSVSQPVSRHKIARAASAVERGEASSNLTKPW